MLHPPLPSIRKRMHKIYRAIYIVMYRLSNIASRGLVKIPLASPEAADPKRGAAGSKRAVPTKGQKGLVGEGAKRIVVAKKGTDPHKWKQRFQRGQTPKSERVIGSNRVRSGLEEANTRNGDRPRKAKRGQVRIGGGRKGTDPEKMGLKSGDRPQHASKRGQTPTRKRNSSKENKPKTDRSEW
jgi:hypothetical protein